MQYLLEERPSASIVRFDGDLSASQDKDLRKMFLDLRNGDHLAVQGADYVFQDLREAGGDLRMFGMGDQLRRLFAITAMDKAFQIFGSESEALDSYGT